MTNRKLESAMKAFQNGDVDGFNTIYQAIHRLVFYVIYGIVKDYQRAEDLLQNVFMTVYEKKDEYRKKESVKAWIIQIARNMALNEWKREQRVVVSERDTIDAIHKKENEANPDTPLIDLAKDILPEDEFLIVMLCVVEGYTRREVGKLLNLSTSGVTWKLNRALEQLRTTIEGGKEYE